MLTTSVRLQSRLSRFVVGLCLILIWGSIGFTDEAVWAQSTSSEPAVPMVSTTQTVSTDPAPRPLLFTSPNGIASGHALLFPRSVVHSQSSCGDYLSPRFVKTEFSIQWVHFWTAQARHIPAVECGIGPYTMELSNEDGEPLPDYFRFIHDGTDRSRESFMLHDLDALHLNNSLSNAYFYYVGPPNVPEEFPRTKFTITITDSRDNSGQTDLWLTVRESKPTLKTNLEEITWTLGQPIDEYVLDIHQKVGRVCDDRILFNLPEGIDVEERDRNIVLSGTPLEATEGRAVFEQILKFDCSSANDSNLISRVYLSIEVVDPNPDTVEPDDAVEPPNRIPKFADEEGDSEPPVTWYRNQKITSIFRLLVENGDGELTISDDLPDGLYADILDGADCFPDSIVPDGVDAEEIRCVKIHGRVPKGDLPKRDSETPYTIEVTDEDGDKGITKVRVNTPKPLLDIPNLNSRIKWIRGQSNTYSPINDLVLEIGVFPTQVIFVERSDSPTPDWMEITTELDADYTGQGFRYTVTISGIPPERATEANIILRATRPECDSPEIDCSDDNLDVFTAQKYKFKFRG